MIIQLVASTRVAPTNNKPDYGIVPSATTEALRILFQD